MSQTVRIYRGIPASGKTTAALKWISESPTGRARINRDSIRKETFGNYRVSNDLEPLVTKIELALFETLVAAGKSVVVDDTNLRMKSVTPFLEIASRYDVPVLFQDFDVDLKVALKNNQNRERKVPEDVIRKMYSSFHKREKNPTAVPQEYVEWYTADVTKPKAVLVDVDGTLMSISPERGPFDWSKVLLDTPNQPVVETVKALKAYGYKIIIMSGRDSAAREDTILSINDAGVEYDELYMRAAGDQRKDWIIKLELFNKYVRENYNIVFALDDRDQVVDFYRKKLGLSVFQVNYGNF